MKKLNNTELNSMDAGLSMMFFNYNFGDTDASVQAGPVRCFDIQ